jgi:hypothetical protein
MLILPKEMPIFLSAFTPRIFIFSINAFRAALRVERSPGVATPGLGWCVTMDFPMYSSRCLEKLEITQIKKSLKSQRHVP